MLALMGLKCILLTDILELLIDLLIEPLSNMNEGPSSKISVEYYNLQLIYSGSKFHRDINNRLSIRASIDRHQQQSAPRQVEPRRP